MLLRFLRSASVIRYLVNNHNISMLFSYKMDISCTWQALQYIHTHIYIYIYI